MCVIEDERLYYHSNCPFSSEAGQDAESESPEMWRFALCVSHLSLRGSVSKEWAIDLYEYSGVSDCMKLPFFYSPTWIDSSVASAVVADCKWCDESGNDDEEIDDEYEIHSRDYTWGICLSFVWVGWLQFFPHMIDYDSMERPYIAAR